MSLPKRSLRLLLLLLTLGFTAQLRAQLAVGDDFPKLAGVAFEGTVPATEGKVLVVDFWASWCAPCKASFPALAKIHSDYAGRGVTVLGVSVDESASAYAAFLKKQAPAFPSVRDREQKLVGTVRVPVMPTTYVIGRDGVILAVLRGYHGTESDHALRTVLDQALSPN
jgi:thiol-disulfide isomerase/thioredoxin